MQTLKTDAFFLIFQTGLSEIPSYGTGDTHSLPLDANGTIGNSHANFILTDNRPTSPLHTIGDVTFDTQFHYAVRVETGTATLLHISFRFSSVESITFNFTGSDRQVHYPFIFKLHLTLALIYI